MGLPHVISGISDFIMKEKLGPSERLHTTNMPSVSGAAIYDYAFRSDNLYPTHECGYLSTSFSVPNMVPVGFHGAGSNSHVGKIIDLKYSQKGGQSAYFMEMTNGIKIFVCVVLNSAGAIYDGAGKLLRGNYDNETEKFIYNKSDATTEDTSGGHTTLTLVCTNLALTSSQLVELSSCAHINMARYISPFATSLDGDVLYMVSTMEHEMKLSYDDSVQFMLAVNDAIRNAIVGQFK
jgi:L-aminopeptidase/D-esterase-like protein